MVTFGIRSFPDPASPEIYFDRINRIFRIIVFTLSGRKRERTIPLAQEE